MKYLLIILALLFTVACTPCPDYTPQLQEKDRIIQELSENITALQERISELETLQSEVERLKGELEQAKIENPKYRDFYSVDELNRFLAEDDTDKNVNTPNVFDCEQFSTMLIARAQEKGFNLYLYPVSDIHMKCLAIVDDGSQYKLYEVEPQDDMVKYIGYLIPIRR